MRHLQGERQGREKEGRGLYISDQPIQNHQTIKMIKVSTSRKISFENIFHKFSVANRVNLRNVL